MTCALRVDVLTAPSGFPVSTSTTTTTTTGTTTGTTMATGTGSHTPTWRRTPGPAPATRVIQLEQDILAKNDLLATRNRDWFADRGILALNLMSSPGAGKTTLLERDHPRRQARARYLGGGG